MDWLRRVGLLMVGVGRATFGVPARSWSAVRWLILFGVFATSFIENARDWIAIHPWEFGLGVLAYGALLYAYDLQVRLEGANSVKAAVTGTEIEFHHRMNSCGKTLREPVLVRVEYSIWNNLATPIRTTRPELDLLRGRWWRIHKAQYEAENRSWGSGEGAVAGQELEIPAYSKRTFRASLTATGVYLRDLARGQYLIRMAYEVPPLGRRVFRKRVNRNDIINYAIPLEEERSRR